MNTDKTPTCKCGCGGLPLKPGKRGKRRRYLEGHAPNYPRPIDPADLSEASVAAFGSRVRVADNGMCLEWVGPKTKNGYGQFTDSTTKRSYGAHRFAYAVLRGPLAAGAQVNHKCDVAGYGRGCVNPWHTFTGSQSDNLLDAAANGFLSRKLMPSQVLEIRALRQAGVSRIVLAKRFRTSRENVTLIVQGHHLASSRRP
jgi:hypothetical protein